MGVIKKKPSLKLHDPITVNVPFDPTYRQQIISPLIDSTHFVMELGWGEDKVQSEIMAQEFIGAKRKLAALIRPYVKFELITSCLILKAVNIFGNIQVQATYYHMTDDGKETHVYDFNVTFFGSTEMSIKEKQERTAALLAHQNE